jgi:hypothetical protein
VQRELAAEHGCGFFSMRTAMGGPGSMHSWVQQGLGHEDRVHFTADGYKKLADLLIDDLLAAYSYDGKLLEHAAQAAAEAEQRHQGKKADARSAPSRQHNDERKGG